LTTARLLVSCPDRPGIVATISRLLFEHGANILESSQYSTDPTGGEFFIRLEFTLPNDDGPALAAELERLAADDLPMTWRLWDTSRQKRLAILVSRYDHCLVELLWRVRRGDLDAEIALVASNHPDLREPVEAEGIRYHHVPVTPDTKPQSEAELLELLRGRCDLVVLARYMQILSPEFLEAVGVPVVNIHHSFLPAFAGANPYQRAKERGVKLIGATAHYVTEELDAGPIIEQDVVRATHHDDVATLTRRGAEIERVVLARAVQWHCEDRVARHGNSTIVF
jgi:formyltetrahydrofolate deformylase